MEYPKLETALLGQVDNTHFYGAGCQGCGHGRRIDLEALRKQLGDAYRLVDVRRRLRCDSCGSKHIIVSYFAPNAITPTVIQLFKQYR